MPIAGVIIIANTDKINETLKNLKSFENITTYGVYKKNLIVAVFEADDSDSLHRLSRDVTEKIPTILGIFPAYVNFEDQI